MNIAVLSGKGGTGKTFVSSNLAYIEKNSTYLDCDVEEPNGHLFFSPEKVTNVKIYSSLPEFDKEKCNGCRKCVDNCKFNALAYILDKPVVFPEICHACGACVLVCDQGAIIEMPKEIGNVEIGKSESNKLVTGILNLGEATGVPIINRVLAEQTDFTIIDCPPGSACSVMESVDAADYCVLVAEPTTFGLHNLKMVHELVSIMQKPYGIVINKADAHAHIIEDFCKEENIKLLASIPFTKELAESGAEGKIASANFPKIKNQFVNILDQIKEDIK